MLIRLLGGVAAIVLAAAAFGGASCKLWLDCHINDDPDAEPSASANHATLPNGFEETTVGSGFVEPTDFAFLPDGQILISEQGGRILALDGTGSINVVLDYRGHVAGDGARGMVTLAVDPDFEAHPDVYVLYAMSPGNVRMRARLSRFTWRKDKLDPTSEQPLIGGAAGVFGAFEGAGCGHGTETGRGTGEDGFGLGI